MTATSLADRTMRTLSATSSVIDSPSFSQSLLGACSVASLEHMSLVSGVTVPAFHIEPHLGQWLLKADEARFDVGRHIWTYRGSRCRSSHSRAHPPQRGGRLRKLEPAQKNETLVCARLSNGARSHTG